MGDDEQLATASESTDALLRRIGQLTRMLHDSMRELGLNKDIVKVAEAIPDARDRLGYVATMTEQAAERALNAIDRAKPLQNAIETSAEELERRWQGWFESPIELEQARELVVDTRTYLKDIPEKTRATNAELLEIMMAQDFQDLTGQVINRMMGMIQDIEHQLVQLLIDNTPGSQGVDAIRSRVEEQWTADDRQGENPLLNGPQVKPDNSDVVSNQDQVDALLDELGF